MEKTDFPASPGPLIHGPAFEAGSAMTVGESFYSSSSYHFKKCLGSGGCADVHLYSRHTAGLPDQDVVIKVFKKSDEGTVRELLNEGLKLARIKHPNILTAFGYEKMGPRFGLVLEYIPGNDLKKLIHLIPEDSRHEMAVHVVAVVAGALAAAHSQNIVHGDISARNVLVSESGQLKLSDFGLARRNNSEAHGTSGSKGSLDYLAPERWQGVAGSLSSDIFALGILAYEILTGINPLQSASIREGRERSLIFQSERPWLQFPAWVEFFEGTLGAAPRERLTADGILKTLPTQSLPVLGLQRQLADCVTGNGNWTEGSPETRSLTRTILFQWGTRIQRATTPRWIQISAIFAFVLFLVVPGATGMDRGVAGFMRPYLLTLTSDPWGEVFVDGRPRGYTPVLNLSVSPGTHDLVWRGPAGQVIRRFLIAFPNGTAAFQILQKKGRSIRIAPILRN